MKWITRKNIKVDRVACPWLIRRFIDPDAEFLITVSGLVMQHLAFSAPLVIGGGLKIVYDLLLYRNFRHLKPPEELNS